MINVIIKRRNLDAETDTQRECHVKIAVMLAQVKELPEASRGLEQTDLFLMPSREHSPVNTLI